MNDRKLAQRLFPDKDPNDQDVTDDLAYLEDCCRKNSITDRFYRIFNTIPRDAIEQAIRKGKSVREVTTRCIELHSTELAKRNFSQEAKIHPTLLPGQRRRGGSGARA